MLSTASLLLRNLFFTILHPGLVTVLFPYWILGSRNIYFIQPWSIYQYFGAFLFAVGLTGLVNCILRFAFEGKGTLSPADPTKKLVISGLYRYTRNPMYVSVTIMLIGEAIYFQSTNLWVYVVIVFILFNVFIMLVEEPRLRRDFGNEYEQYCRKVRRWI